MRTILDVLRDNARLPDRAMTFLGADGAERRLPFPALWDEVRRRGRALRDQGLQRGDRVLLVLTEAEEFVLSFFGALAGGVVPVPVFPPHALARLDAWLATTRHVLTRSGARGVVMDDAFVPFAQGPLAGTSARLIPLQALQGAPALDPGPELAAAPGDLAFLQFTSGSTDRPKGVMVTHGNLSANSRCIMIDGLGVTPQDRGVSWLPLYHDMGLIGCVIAPLFTATEVTFLPTLAFVARPAAWLDAIHRARATLSFAPNFAYALAARAAQPAPGAAWDLSCLRALGCGAEPIQAEVLRAFAARFAPYGLRRECLLPCYGLAEATLAAAFAGVGRGLRSELVDRAALQRGEVAPAGEGAAAQELVCCGPAFPGHELRVCGADGAPLGERCVGEVQLRGPSVAAGYFDAPEETAQSFPGGWLRTGDLGFLGEGELYLCGRSKDLIIVHGRNYHPQDIERVVSAVAGVRAGNCAAFARLDGPGGERAVVVAEVRGGDPAGLQERITQAVRAELGLLLQEVHLIPRGALPKTSSGKVQRRECRRRLEAGELALA